MDDANATMTQLFAEAGRIHSLVGAVSYQRGRSELAADHYRLSMDFQRRQHKSAAPDQSELYRTVAYVTEITRDYQAELDLISGQAAEAGALSNTSAPDPRIFTTLQPNPYCMDQHGNTFLLDENFLVHQVSSRPPSAIDVDTLSTSIVMFNLSLCHLMTESYEKGTQLLLLSARALAGHVEKAWARPICAAILANDSYIAEAQEWAQVMQPIETELDHLIQKEKNAPAA